MECLNYTDIKTDKCDDFYIDKPYKFNLYDYTQKFDATKRLKAHRLGFTSECETETNWFTGEPNIIKGGKYLKPKTKSPEYYEYISKLGGFKESGEFLVVDRTAGHSLDGLVFNASVIQQFVEYLKEMFRKGLWLNNFNNYSIRYDEWFHWSDPDIFYVIEHNDKLKHLKTVEEFMSAYAHYKLRQKDIIYRISDPICVTKEVLEYIYYSYWFLENVSRVVQNGY